MLEKSVGPLYKSKLLGDFLSNVLNICDHWLDHDVHHMFYTQWAQLLECQTM
jgi:hypothetical protein